MKNKFPKIFIGFIFLFLVSAQCFADDIFSKNVNALKNYHFQIATVSNAAPAKLHFYQNDAVGEGFCPAPTDSEFYINDNSKSMNGCPAFQTSCELKPYLVPGDHVLVIKSYKEFSCAWYISKNGLDFNYGWLPTKFLVVSDYNPSIISPNDWLGKWNGSASQITFSKSNKLSQLAFNGNAQWVGQGEGNVNVGSLENEIANLNNDTDTAVYTSDDCQIYFKLLKFGDREALFAIDNGECGGLNVTFTGFYRKK